MKLKIPFLMIMLILLGSSVSFGILYSIGKRKELKAIKEAEGEQLLAWDIWFINTKYKYGILNKLWKRNK